MRLAFLLGVLGACDPVWHVANVTTPTATTRANEACVDAALHATTFTIKPMGENAPKRGWYVSAPSNRTLRVTWDPTQPQKLTLLMVGVGQHAPPDTLVAFRSMREAVLEKVRDTCGPFDPGPEHCLRMQCASDPAKPPPS